MSIAIPAHAALSDVDELKALVLKLQKRVDQLENTRHTPVANDRMLASMGRPALVVKQDTSIATRSAQQAASQAQRAAALAQQAAIQAQEAGDRATREANASKASAAAEIKTAFSTSPGKPKGSFRIPGTETIVRVYGFVKLNGASNLTSQEQLDVLNVQGIPLSGTAAQRQGRDTQLSARRSRFDLETWTPVNETVGEFHTLMEADFGGQSTNLATQYIGYGYIPRMRKFYADFGKPVGGFGSVLFGQENSVYNDSSLLPIQWLNDATFVGMSGMRQGQIRYTYGFGSGVSAAVAVESPYSDITTATGTNYPDSNGAGAIGWHESPDVTARLLWKQKWGLLAVRGVMRPQISLNNQTAASASARFNESTTGFGVGVTGVVNLLDDALVLVANANAGNGLGRYLDSTTTGYSAVSNAGLPGVNAQSAKIDAVSVYSGMVGLQYFFTPTIRTNMSVGGATLSYPGYVSQLGGCVGATLAVGTCGAANKTLWMESINLIWSPFQALDIGLEYTHAERNLQSSITAAPGVSTNGGVQNRLQATLIGRF